MQRERILRFIDFFTMFVFLLFSGYSITFVQYDTNFVIINIILLLMLFYRKGHLDFIIFYVLLLWIVINILSVSIFNTNQSLSFNTLLGTSLRITFSYLVVRLLSIRFIEKYVKFVVYLTLISLPIFILQQFFTEYFFSIAKYFSFLTQEEQIQNGGFSSGIYMFSGWATDRNCGFAWEPGAFSFYLIVAIIFQLLLNNIRFDRYIAILCLGVITTFSTSGFIALMIVGVALSIQTYNKIKNPLYLILYLSIPVLFYTAYTKIDFLKSKIDQSWDTKDVVSDHFSGIERINRIGEFERSLESSLYNPFGNGTLMSEHRINKWGYAVGPNSVAMILNQWGWLGLFAFLFTAYGLFSQFRISWRRFSGFLLLCAFIMPIFSNPFTIRPVVFSVFFYYMLFVYNKEVEFRALLTVNYGKRI